MLAEKLQTSYIDRCSNWLNPLLATRYSHCMRNFDKHQFASKAMRKLAPKRPRTEGLRNLTPNTDLLSGQVQPIDYWHY